LKEQLYGFTQEEIFDRKSREKIRNISGDTVMKFQINQLMDRSMGSRTWSKSRY
jgi:hypothetical protein